MEERKKRKPKPQPRTATQIFLGEAYEELKEVQSLLKNPETVKEAKTKLNEALETLKIVLNIVAPKNEDNDELDTV